LRLCAHHGSSIARTDSSLLQVLFDALCFPQEKRDVQVRGFHEGLDDVQGLREFLGELVVLLVAPGIAQISELALKRRHAIAQVRVELLQILGKTTQFIRISYGTRHGNLKSASGDSGHCPRAESNVQ